MDAIRARLDEGSLRIRGILRFNPDEPRIPGGEHGGEWSKVGAEVKKAVSALSDAADNEDFVAESPRLLETARGGHYSVAAFEDVQGFGADGVGMYGPAVGGRLVSIGDDGEKPRWKSDGPDAGTVFQASHAAAIADSLDSMSARMHKIPAPTDPHAFDNGPAVLDSQTVKGWRVTAFYDGNGDLGDENSRFIQVTDGSNWEDSLGGGNRAQLTVDSQDVAGLVAAIRQVV